MKNNILISGGMGYLAQNLLKLLGQKDYFFILLDITDKRPNNKNIKYIHTDISKGENLEKELFYFFKKNKIKIDGIVNTPAWNNFESLEKTKFFEIEKIINTKLIGYANIIKSTLPYLNNGASIVNIGSAKAHSNRDFGAMYAAANGGIISLTKAMAIELRKSKIRVNAVSPGGFDSDVYKKSHSDWKIRIENGQCLSTTDVSRVIKFLLSNESAGINGAEIIVDGGISVLRARSLDF